MFNWLYSLFLSLVIFIQVCSLQFDMNSFQAPEMMIFHSKQNPPINANTPVRTIKMKLEKPFLETHYDSTFELECVGNRPIDWTISHSYYGLGGEKEIIEYVEYENQETLYTSKLKLSNSRYLDTTLYTCKYNDTSMLDVSNVKEYSASVYVYVNDDENLFTPVYHTINVSPDVSFDIPCRVTDPKTNVTLLKQGEAEGKMIPFNFTKGDVDFHPQRGFIVNNNHLFRTGIHHLYCIAVLKDLKKAVFLALNVLPKTMDVPRLFIEESEEQSANSLTFSLNCFVDIGLSENVVLQWNYPNKKEGNSTGRYIIIKQVESNYKAPGSSNFVKRVSSRLTITDTKKMDEGFYTCEVYKDGYYTNGVINYKIKDRQNNLAPFLLSDWMVSVLCFSCGTFAYFSLWL